MKLEKLKHDIQEIKDISAIDLERSRSLYLETLKAFSVEHNSIFITLLCKGTLGEDAKIEINGEMFEYPFMDSPGQKGNRKLKGFEYLAKFVLNALDNPLERKDKPTVGIISVAEYIEYEFRISTKWPMTYVKCDDIYFTHLAFNFFNSLSETLGSLIFSYVNSVFRGVPVYKQYENSKDFYLLDDSDRDYVYLVERGRNQDGVSSYEMPQWAKRCFVNIEHINKFYAFDNSEFTPTDHERDILFSTFRKLIGVSASQVVVENYGSSSKLYRLMQAVISRYYGETFNVNDSDTWTSQKNVVEWLMHEHQLSKREAEAIDIVTRPDNARKK